MRSTRTDRFALALPIGTGALVLLAALALFVVASIAARGTAVAQVGVFDESTCREVPPAQLSSDPALAKIYLKFNAKVYAIAGPDEMYVRENERVPMWLDEKLVAGSIMSTIHDGDNVRVFGHLTSRRGRGLGFLVKELEKRPDDLTLYRSETAALERSGDAALLLALGARIEAEGQSQKRAVAYRPVAHEAYRAALRLKEAALKPEDSAGWVALAAEHLRLLGDRKETLARLLRALKPGEVAASAEALRMLTDLNAVFYGGKYVLFEEMKRAEGFIERTGRWVRDDRARFEDAVDVRRSSKVKLRKLLDDYYAEVARSGLVELGMNKAEVVRALGFPDDFDRERRGREVYDAWTYEGKGTYYFENNELFRTP